jgi:hypothetical protein
MLRLCYVGYRCWNYSNQVGAANDHPLLCERCVDVIRASDFKLPGIEATSVAAAAT